MSLYDGNMTEKNGAQSKSNDCVMLTLNSMAKGQKRGLIIYLLLCKKMLKKLVILASYMKTVAICFFLDKVNDFPLFLLILYDISKSKNQLLVHRRGRACCFRIIIVPKL